MNDIGLVIFGNLTGFSNFYTNASAGELYKDYRIDFDSRNSLSFLNDGEKIYSISFAGSYIALGVITRVLDSFRRPGILVIALLVPRKYQVVNKNNPLEKGAAYRLLNEVNDRFYERNYQNGLVNQSISALMQDYYSDILSGYELERNDNQPNISLHVDVTTRNPKIGYVRSQENDIPLYLNTPCRKKYDGCNHVFFAGNAPQNIDEEPEEVVLYKVRVTNNNQQLPQLARLKDKIYNLNPSMLGVGFRDINKDYTYQQVIAGEAGSEISAECSDTTISITYKFPKEERIVCFDFYCDSKKIDFVDVQPVISNAATQEKRVLQSSCCRFFGSEIYSNFEISCSQTSKYVVRSDNSTLHINELGGDNCIIQLQLKSSIVTPTYHSEVHRPIAPVVSEATASRLQTPRVSTPNSSSGSSQKTGAHQGKTITDSDNNPGKRRKLNVKKLLVVILSFTVLVVACIFLVQKWLSSPQKSVSYSVWVKLGESPILNEYQDADGKKLRSIIENHVVVTCGDTIKYTYKEGSPYICYECHVDSTKQNSDSTVTMRIELKNFDNANMKDTTYQYRISDGSKKTVVDYFCIGDILIYDTLCSIWAAGKDTQIDIPTLNSQLQKLRDLKITNGENKNKDFAERIQKELEAKLDSLRNEAPATESSSGSSDLPPKQNNDDLSEKIPEFVANVLKNTLDGTFNNRFIEDNIYKEPINLGCTIGQCKVIHRFYRLLEVYLRALKNKDNDHQRYSQWLTDIKKVLDDLKGEIIGKNYNDLSNIISVNSGTMLRQPPHDVTKTHYNSFLEKLSDEEYKKGLKIDENEF